MESNSCMIPKFKTNQNDKYEKVQCGTTHVAPHYQELHDQYKATGSQQLEINEYFAVASCPQVEKRSTTLI